MAKLTVSEYHRAEGAHNALDLVGPEILKLRAKVAELQSQLAAKWISVKERLPEPIGTKEEIQAVRGYSFTASVLVCEKQTRDVIVATLWRSPSGPVHWEVQGGYYSENCSGDCTPRIALKDVTHWQPLPAAPTPPGEEAVKP